MTITPSGEDEPTIFDDMPGLLAAAWEEGANAAWERSTPEVNGALYMWRSEGDPVNPYRPTK